MPFGLASAPPRDFTKLLRPVATFLTREGIRVVIYGLNLVASKDPG